MDLCRIGEAYTGGSGVSDAIAQSINQLELDFAQDPDPETLFPSGDDCGGRQDLHLSVVREEGSLMAKLQCPRCRELTSHPLETCIPLPLVTLNLFGCLFEIKRVSKKYDGVIRYDNLLRTEFESKWEELGKLRRSSQQPLFETVGSGELGLIKR